METLLEYIITDFHERELPQVLPRDAQLPQIPGKTYFLYQAMQRQLEKGIPKERILYINFDDERLLPLAQTELNLIPTMYYRMFPEFKKEKCYFYFDEIQNV